MDRCPRGFCCGDFFCHQITRRIPVKRCLYYIYHDSDFQMIANSLLSLRKELPGKHRHSYRMPVLPIPKLVQCL